MAKIYSTIAMATSNVAEVMQCLARDLGIIFTNTSSSRGLGLHFSVSEAPEEWLTGVDSCGNSLPEAEPFYSHFDVSTFKTHIDVFCGRTDIMADYIHVVSDAIGRTVSSEVGIRAIVFFNGTEVPFRLYDRGRLAIDFGQYYKEYINTLPWIPK